MDVDRTPTGLLSPWTESRLFDEAFLDSLAEYGPNEVLQDAARAELEAGGFERDSDGNWLFADGDRAGQPMSFTVQAHFGATGVRPSGVTGSTQSFVDAASEFGIEVEFFDRAQAAAAAVPDPADFEIALADWGGSTGIAATVYEETFRGGEPAPDFPAAWIGPPVGDAGGDRTEEYAVDDLLDGLVSPGSGIGVETSLRRIAWVFNRGLPRLPLGYEPIRYQVNASDWAWPLPIEDSAGAWVSGPAEKLWSRGSVRSGD